MSRMLASLLPFAWGLSAFSKAVYLFIGLNRYKASPVPCGISPIHVPLCVMGLLATTLGVLLVRQLHRNPRFYSNPVLKSMVRGFVHSDFSGNETLYVHFYFIGLGLCETAALFGLVGFVSKGNLPFFLIMIALSLAGWALNYPRLSRVGKLAA